MKLNEFVQTFTLKSKATSNIKIQQDLFSIALDNNNIHLTDGPFSRITGIVILHLSKGRHWVAFINENYFESYGHVPPKKISKKYY